MLALAPCFAFTVVLGLLSDGVFHDDDLTHFLMARWAHWFPGYLLHIWGRPGLTIPLAAVAWIGDASTSWHAARFLSAMVTALTAWLAARLAIKLGIRPAWAVVLLCYAQPLNTLLACTTLTENFAALYLITSVFLLYSRRLVAASLVFSLVLITRHEAAVLLPIWWLAVLGHGTSWSARISAGLASLAAPAVHNLAFRLVYHTWPIDIFAQPHGSTEYPAIGLLGYVPHALTAIPPLLAGLALIGGLMLIRRGLLLIPALAAAYFLTHVAIKALGVFASGGYGRFMVVIAPLVALLAAAGLHDLRACLRNRRPTGAHWLVLAAVWPIGLLALEIERRGQRLLLREEWAAYMAYGAYATVGILVIGHGLCWLRARNRNIGAGFKAAAFLLILAAAIQWGVLVHPLKLTTGPKQVGETVTWLREARLDREPFFATNPWFAYFLDLVEDPRAHKSARLLAAMPVGTVVVWDSVYSQNDYHHLPLDSLRADPAYQLLRNFATRPKGLEVYIFRKVSETPIPAESGPVYPAPLESAEQPLLGIYYLRADEQ